MNLTPSQKHKARAKASVPLPKPRNTWKRWRLVMFLYVFGTILAVLLVYWLITTKAPPTSAPSDGEPAGGAFSSLLFPPSAPGRDARRGIRYDRSARLRVLGVQIGEVVA